MPSDNLPFLFAAYAVTWVGFFIYAFFVSRRQQQLEHEIETLRSLMETRGETGESESE